MMTNQLRARFYLAHLFISKWNRFLAELTSKN